MEFLEDLLADLWFVFWPVGDDEIEASKEKPP